MINENSESNDKLLSILHSRLNHRNSISGEIISREIQSHYFEDNRYFLVINSMPFQEINFSWHTGYFFISKNNLSENQIEGIRQIYKKDTEITYFNETADYFTFGWDWPYTCKLTTCEIKNIIKNNIRKLKYSISQQK